MTRHPLRRPLASVALLSAGLLLLSARPAGAATITPGSVTFFNFDFTSQVPPPPYVSISSVAVGFANVDAGDMGAFDFFDGLNGTGVTFNGSFSGLVPSVSLIFVGIIAPQSLDGIFSLRAIGTGGTFDILSVVATAQSATGATVHLTGVPVAAVPEPATIVLFATGLAGALARRRRLHS
jgi:hypothetical protein